MPYRHAHTVILLILLPAIGVAFWPGYLGTLPTASFAQHAHGITASLWVLLVMAQSWTVHARRFAWHRALARTTLGLVPLFAGGAALAIHSMAGKFVGRSDPFSALFGARLAMDDILASALLVWMVRRAIVERRRVGVHAAYMLSTVLLVLPPVVARLPLPVPDPLASAFGISAVISLALWAVRRRDGWPFLITAVLTVVRLALFETVAATEGWARMFALLPQVPAVLVAGIAMLAAGAAIWTVWPWQGRPRGALAAG